MSGRRGLELAAVLIVAVAVAAVVATRGDSGPRLSRGVSNPGRTVPIASLGPVDRAELDAAGVVELRLLAAREGLHFYRGFTATGDSCVMLARPVGGEDHLSFFGCPSSFVSDKRPVLDLSVYSQGLDDAYPVITELAGFAADGVDAVGIRTTAGDLRWTPVEDNVYLARPTDVRAAAVLVRDDTGTITTSWSAAGRTLREQYATAP